MHKVNIRRMKQGGTHIIVDGVALEKVLKADIKMRINQMVVLEVYQHDEHQNTKVITYPIEELTILGNLE